MRLPHPAAIAGILILSFGIPSVSAMQAPTDAAAASPYTYADIADLATEAPIVLHVSIRDAPDMQPERTTRASGRAPWREGVCPYESIQGRASQFTKKSITNI